MNTPSALGEPQIYVNDGYDYIGVLMCRGNLLMGVVEATLGKKKTWFLNRVIIQAESDRRKGVGSKLLLKLLEKLREQSDCKRLVVIPSDYEHNTKAQAHFYRKNGFKRHKSGFLYWKASWPIPPST